MQEPLAERQARRPVQGRSQARCERIIKTLEGLLQNSSIEDISFYDIADRADVSPASINCPFPTMADLRAACTNRWDTTCGEAPSPTLRRAAPA